MLKINLSFLSNSTNNWSQPFIDSVSFFGGKAFKWIQETHKNEFIGYGMFAAVTTVSFLSADRIATILSPRIDTRFTTDGTEMTSDRKQFKSFLLNGVITGGLTYTGNLLYSTLSGHTVPQAIMLATTVAACALRYFAELKREKKRGKTIEKNQLNAEKNKLKSENDELKKKIDQLQREVNKYQEVNTETEKTFDILEAEHQKMKESIHILLSQLTSENTELKKEIDQLQKEVSEHKAKKTTPPPTTPQLERKQLVISTKSEENCHTDASTVPDNNTGKKTHNATPRRLDYEGINPMNIYS